MKSKIYRDLFILLAVFLVGWLIFTLVRFKPKTPDVGLSIEDEEKIGDVLTDALFDQMDEIESEKLDGAMELITYRLTEALDSQTYNYKFHTVESSEINAFATLGGHIYVFSSLIEVMETPEELAAVIAHEMGHVEERHVVNKMAREYGIAILFGALSGGDPTLITELVEMSVSTVFSRKQESEADEFGLKLLENAQIDPQSLATAFVKLKQKGGDSFVPAFLQSHPQIDARIADAMAYETDKDFEAKSFKIEWEEVVEEIETSTDYHIDD